jgi:hypothetical protein
MKRRRMRTHANVVELVCTLDLGDRTFFVFVECFQAFTPESVSGIGLISGELD